MPFEAAALFWDHDGLLVETERLFHAVTRDLFLAKGIDLSPQLWSKEYLSKGRGTSVIVADFGLSKSETEPIIAERNRRYHDLLEQQPPLCPFALETLNVLKRRFPMALVTGNSRRAIETVHRSTGVLALFDAIITQENYERAKPFPDSYLCAAKQLSVDPRRCIAIEDSERGMSAALAAGMRCIVVPSELTRDQTFEGASSIESSLERLPSLLTRSTE